MTKFMPQRGFVLIEVAIALFVLALILGGILAPLNAQVEQGKIRDTNKVISDINEALLGYVMINGRLPRPATSSTNGVENAAACGSPDPERACTGFIPWTTLGSGKLDAWGNIIRYSVTPAFANSAFALITLGTKTIQERNAVGGLVDYATNVPVIVWSTGPENFGTNGTAAVRANNSSGVTNADEITNNTASTTFIRRIQVNNSAATGGEFDDIVTFIPTAILVDKAIAAGKLP
jgi:prepilin-type N-terminal cleavage/methylation domain-containing protein